MQLFAYSHQMMSRMHRLSSELLYSYYCSMYCQLYCCSIIGAVQKLNWSLVIGLMNFVNTWTKQEIALTINPGNIRPFQHWRHHYQGGMIFPCNYKGSMRTN